MIIKRNFYKNLALFFFILVLISFNCIGQNCFCVSGTKNKKDGTESRGGVVGLNEHSLLINKIISVSDTIPKYYLTLTAVSQVLLPDSTLKSEGTFELQLQDNSKVIFTGATSFNHAIGQNHIIGFQVKVTKEQFKIISKNPIATLTVFNNLVIPFSIKKQKEQQNIVNCLLNNK